MTTPAVLDADGQRGAGGHPRRDGVGASPRCTTSPARPTSATRPPARSTSSSRRCTVRTRWRSPTTCSPPSRRLLGLPREHDQGRHHGRGAAHDGQPRRVHPRRPVPRGVHQHRLPRPHRRRDPHLDARRRRWCARPTCARSGGSWPTRTGTSTPAWPAGCAGGPRSARACGRRPTAWPTCSTRRSGTPWPGASCAWVPSPTAATLHATHYHRVDVGERQQRAVRSARRGPRSTTCWRSRWPVPRSSWTDDERRAEVDNNVQGILGYVVRWIDQGVGCSKVPDINGVALMEDRATCRISSQHVANWLAARRRDRASRSRDSFRRMAVVVDGQNAGRPRVRADGARRSTAARSSPRPSSSSRAPDQPYGYTEPILHRRRAEQQQRRARRDRHAGRGRRCLAPRSGVTRRMRAGARGASPDGLRGVRRQSSPRTPAVTAMGTADLPGRSARWVGRRQPADCQRPRRLPSESVK